MLYASLVWLAWLAIVNSQGTRVNFRRPNIRNILASSTVSNEKCGGFGQKFCSELVGTEFNTNYRACEGGYRIDSKNSQDEEYVVKYGSITQLKKKSFDGIFPTLLGSHKKCQITFDETGAVKINGHPASPNKYFYEDYCTSPNYFLSYSAEIVNKDDICGQAQLYDVTVSPQGITTIPPKGSVTFKLTLKKPEGYDSDLYMFPLNFIGCDLRGADGSNYKSAIFSSMFDNISYDECAVYDLIPKTQDFEFKVTNSGDAAVERSLECGYSDNSREQIEKIRNRHRTTRRQDS